MSASSESNKHSNEATTTRCTRSNQCNVLSVTIVFLCCTIMGLVYYCVDIIGGLEATIIKVVRIDLIQYNILFSSYSWADIVMSFLGGIVIDKVLGVRLGFIVILSIAVCSQCILTLGAYLGLFWVMLIGRILFGCTVGTVTALVNNVSVTVCSHHPVLAISSKASAARLSAGIALLTTQNLYDLFSFLPASNIKLGATMAVALVALMVSLLCGALLFTVDRKLGKLKLKKSFTVQQIVFAVKKFGLSFWLVSLMYSTYYLVIFSMIGNGQLFFISKYGMSINEASLVNSLTYAATVLFSPFIALLISFTKHYSKWMMFGIVIGLVAHVIFMVGSDNIALVYFAAILLSFSFSITVGIFPAYTGLLIKQEYLTIAFGIHSSLYSLFYCLVSAVEGAVIDEYGFIVYETTNVAIIFVTLLLCGMLMIEERDNKIFKSLQLAKNLNHHYDHQATITGEVQTSSI